jgi:predicted phosphodiesterase
MRLLVLSDVHADAAALDAVLADAAGGFEALVLLGDLIGYGDDPVATVDALRALDPLARVRGNHEAMLAELRAGAVPDAARPVRDRLAAHGEALDDDALAWLLEAPERDRYAAEGGPVLDLVHGGPRPGRPFEVLLGVPAARRALPHLQGDLLLFGHSHVPGGFVEVDGRLRPIAARGRETVLELRRGRRWLLNPGSVGRPRDGGPAGCSLLLDLAQGTVRFRRIDAPA